MNIELFNRQTPARSFKKRSNPLRNEWFAGNEQISDNSGRTVRWTFLELECDKLVKDKEKRERIQRLDCAPS